VLASHSLDDKAAYIVLIWNDFNDALTGYVNDIPGNYSTQIYLKDLLHVCLYLLIKKREIKYV
jgi:hypothetical protein